MRTAILIPILASVVAAADLPYNRALEHYDHANYRQAIELLSPDTPDPKALELLGKSLYMEGDFKEAANTLQKAASLAPGDSMTQTWLARALGGLADSSFAVSAFGYARQTREAFENAVHLNPKNAEALNDLFDFYRQAPRVVGGGVDKARNLIPRIEQADPIGGHLAWAELHEDGKEFGKAEMEIREAIRMAPDKPGLQMDLAAFLSRQGRYDESDKAFERAASLAPGSPHVFYAKAAAYIAAGRNLDQARSLLRTYLAAKNLTPDDPTPWEARKLLKKAKGL